MHVVVDSERCEGHGRCEATAPDLFRLDADAVLHVLHDQIPEEMQQRAHDAVRLCPVAALKVDA